MLRAFLGLAIVLAREAELHQFLAHRIGADRMPHGGQDRGQFVHALRHPQQRAHGIAERGRFEEALQCGHETGISRGDSLAAGAGTPYLTFRQFLAIEIVLAAIDGRTGKPGDPRDHRKPRPGRPFSPRPPRTSAARVRQASSRPCPSDSESHLHRSCHPGYKCSPRSGIPTPRVNPPHARAPRFAYCSGRPKATLRARRSSFAITRTVLNTRQSLSASLNCGRAAFVPLSTSVNSANSSPEADCRNLLTAACWASSPSPD